MHQAYDNKASLILIPSYVGRNTRNFFFLLINNLKYSMSVQGDKESKFGSNGKIFISSSLSGCEPTDRKSQALAEFKKKKKENNVNRKSIFLETPQNLKYFYLGHHWIR